MLTKCFFPGVRVTILSLYQTIKLKQIQLPLLCCLKHQALTLLKTWWTWYCLPSLLEREILCVLNACITKFYMFHCRSMLLGIELSQILFASHSAWDGTYDLATMFFLYYAILMISCTISNSAHFQESYMCILKKAHEWWPWTFIAEEKSKYPKLERDGFAFKVPKLLFS